MQRIFTFADYPSSDGWEWEALASDRQPAQAFHRLLAEGWEVVSMTSCTYGLRENSTPMVVTTIAIKPGVIE